jgi:iron complex outermembrane receptor protein
VNYSKLRGALTGASLLCIATAAIGQTTPAASSGHVATGGATAIDATDASADIVVTARRRDESLQDVPMVVNAVTQEEAEKLNFRTFQDVQAVVPGLNLSTQSNGTGGSVTLRGVNFDVNASGFNPTVQFYYNDAPIDSGLVLQSLFDVGQIEVLRGPQGTLRGRSSPSGSITLTTHRPDLYAAGANLVVTANDIGTQNINGGIGVPIIEGKAAIRIAGVYNVDDYDRVHTINGSVDHHDPYSETKGARISARVQPVDWLSLDGSYQRLDRFARTYDQVASYSEANPAAPVSPVFIPTAAREGIGSSPRTVHQKYNVFTGQAQISLAGQRLVYVFGRDTFGIQAFTPQDQANFFPNTSFGQNAHTYATQTSHEVRLQNDARVLGMFDYVVGGLFLKTTTTVNLIQQTPVTLPAFLGGRIVTIANTPIQTGGEPAGENSGFANLTAHLGDKAEISGGLRYLSVHTDGFLLINNATRITNPTIDAHHVIYTASAKYSFTPDLTAYVSAGSSYRPAINATGDFSVQQSALEQSFISLPPETSRSYEIGFKSSLFDRRVRLNAAVFHQDFTNYPYRAPGNGVYYINNNATAAGVTPTVSVFNFVAAVPVHVNGAEGEIDFAPTKQWDIGLLASYALGRIKNGNVPCNDLNGDGVPDSTTSAPTLAQLQAATGANHLSSCRVSQRSSFQPPFSATVTSEYRMPISGKTDAYLRGLLSFYGKSIGDPSNAFDDVGNYALLNLYAGLRDAKGRWELSVFAKNVAQVRKALSRSIPNSTSYQVLAAPTFTTAVGATASSTYTNVTETPPREIGVSLRWNFGSR